MGSKSYWMWHYGEYEIFHSMQANLRREEQGYYRPPFWKVSTPYVSVKFQKTFTSDGGYLKCYINGQGCVIVNNARYQEKKRIELPKGEVCVEIVLSNQNGIPAAFVESDVCPSDESWTCNHYAGEFLPVGINKYFDSPDKNPDVFPFSYENKQPLATERVEGGLLFDFGRELFGYLNINGCDAAAEYGIFYGESREEALDTPYTYLTETVSGKSDYRLTQRAFRYVYVKGADERVSVSADYEYLPFEQMGRFECDNELFNKIYDAAAYTFHLNCRETHFDGIKRDRWTWAGDAYQSSRINAYLFADKEIDQRTAIGLVGKEPIEQQINTIMDYSFLWMIGLKEHLMSYGDLDFIARIYPMALKLLRFCELRENKDGFIEGIGDDWTFIDWSPMDKEGAIAAEQMLMIEAYKSFAIMSEALGYDSAEFTDKAQKLTERVNEYFWSDELGAFIDSYTTGKNNVTRHANIFAVMYGIATEEQKQSILENVLRNDNIHKITTPYFKGYELDVLGAMGEYSAIEEQISSYWGGMIELGATTIWEEFDPTLKGIEHYEMYGGKYEKSLCHAWGAGPIYILGKYYLGVKPTSIGFATFTVEPRLGGLRRMKGSAPINGGVVTVELDESKLSVKADKDGGTLIWQGKSYALKKGEELRIEL